VHGTDLNADGIQNLERALVVTGQTQGDVNPCAIAQNFGQERVAHQSRHQSDKDPSGGEIGIKQDQIGPAWPCDLPHDRDGDPGQKDEDQTARALVDGCGQFA